MKKNRILYGIAIFSVIGIFVSFVGYATKVPVEHTPKQHGLVKTVISAGGNTSTVSATPAKSSKSTIITNKVCGCCANQAKRAQKKSIQQAREHRLAAENGTHNE